MKELSSPLESFSINEDIRSSLARTGMAHINMTPEGSSVSQLLNSMQQHGWNLIYAGDSPLASSESPASGASAVLIGKLSRRAS